MGAQPKDLSNKQLQTVAESKESLPPDQSLSLVVKSIVNEEKKQIFDLKSFKSDLGPSDSFRYKICTWVLGERYDQAIQELKEFIEGPSEYPDFYKRTHRYINHCVDLIYAIKAKRNFPGISSLTRARQQELREKFKEHFKELVQILTKVEQIETDLRVSDVKSTIYVVKALWISGTAVVLLAFFLEMIRGLASTGFVVFDDVINVALAFLFKFID